MSAEQSTPAVPDALARLRYHYDPQTVMPRPRSMPAAYGESLQHDADVVLVLDRLDAREREKKEMREVIGRLQARVTKECARAEQAERDRTTLAAILNVVDVPAHNAAVLRSGADMMEYTHAMERGVASSSRGSADHA